MANVLVRSTKELQNIKQLLDADIPTYRQAYSDRTSWIMACLSELAYVKFNEPPISKDDTQLMNKASELIDEGKLASLKKLIHLFSYDHEKEKEKLISDLNILNMKIIKTFDTHGTQAILVSSSKFYVLAFRGTEITSISDIKADLKAKTMECESGGKIHTGFNDAFAEVHTEIQNFINTIEEALPLFITGHSLGGALATVATKKLTYKYGIASCYTYGSPRVADEEWIRNIKTPIYRLVNSADPVTMLPPGSDTINFIAWLIKFLPYIGRSARTILLSNLNGYYHSGDMRYLTHINKGDYRSAKVLYHVSFLRRLRAYFFNKAHFTDIPNDHSISIYRKKLKEIAMRRNQSKRKYYEV